MTLSKLAVLALTTTALAPLAGVSARAGVVLPTGGKVVAGQAAIGAPSGSALTISQSSGNAIIDWNGFSIGAGGAVQFNNGSGATLNRVTGAQVSSLDGLLSATGSVYLINPNGVIVGKDGVVNVGGTFVASTLDTSNAGFLAGGPLTFAGPSTAAVVNYGKIGSLGGDVALVAGTVSNAGSITAANGDAGLLAGTEVVLTDASLDQGRFAVLLGGPGTSTTNSGLIQAADAELRAEGGNVYALAGDTAGVIRATGVQSGGGHVWLVADGGTLDVGGTLDAQGQGAAGGTIETSGATVNLGSAAIDAHGGTWMLDPTNLEITPAAAVTISDALANANVTETTTASGSSDSANSGAVASSGAGDITLDAGAAINWGSTYTLTLSAYHDVDIDGTISMTGAGALILRADNAATGLGQASGTVNFSLPTPQITATGGGTVTIYYNPVSYADSATGSTLGSNDALTNPYTADVTGVTPSAYMLIDTLTQLQAMSTQLAGVYALNANIDASATATMNPIAGGGYEGFIPIGNVDNGGTPFTGVLDGQGHTVSNLYINGAVQAGPDNAALLDVGLIGALSDYGVLENLTIANATVTASSGNNGIAVGLTGASNPLITNVITSGVITGGNSTGGLVGADAAIVTNSSSSAAVTAAQYVGGLVGYGSGLTLTNDYATGAVTGGSGAGGLVGRGGGTFTNVYATGAVSGSSQVGGLIGVFSSGTITNAYATGDVSTNTTTAQVDDVGGLIGNAYENSTFTNVYATGSVTATPPASDTNDNTGNVGGLIGDLGSSAVLTNAYSTGAVVSTGASVGGLVGDNQGEIYDSYASGAVTGAGSVGGLVGYADWYGSGTGSTITDSYATGAVTGVQSTDSDIANFVGGAVGWLTNQNAGPNAMASATRVYATGLVSGVGVLGGFAGQNDGTITDSIWDRTSTGQSVGVGPTTSPGLGLGTINSLTSVQDTNPSASDYAFSATPYTNAGFSFGNTPGGSTATPWVQIDADGSFNGAGGAAVGTRPFLLMEYTTTISNAHQLQLMTLDLDAAYTLIGNVDASGTATTASMWGPAGFVPIDPLQVGFSGSLNGQGFAISDLTINAGAASYDVGLFGDLATTATVSNLTLSGGSVNGFGVVGDLAGVNYGTVTGVMASGSVSGATEVGGLVGDNEGTISNSTASGAVSDFVASLGGGNSIIGGLAGQNEGTISASSASGAVTGASGDGGVAGGLVGQSLSGSSITASFATGVVNGTQFVGGLVGVLGGASLSDSYATGAVNGASQVGGLVGAMTQESGDLAQISASYATGAVSATRNQAGGLVGGDTGDAITNSYATGSVSGASQVGGLVGASLVDDVSNPGTVYFPSITGTVPGATYASGPVTATGSAVGGLVGYSQASISTTSASGSVSGAGMVGGLVGENYGAMIYDSHATGNVSGTSSQVGGLVGASLNDTTTYAGKDVLTPDISGGSGFGNTYATGTVTGGGTGTGGVVGENDGAVSYVSYTNTGAGVSGAADAGGAVGLNDADGGVVYVLVAAKVTSTSYTGGIVGDNFGGVGFASMTAGSVSGGGGVGGGVGVNESSGSLSDLTIGGSGTTIAVTGTANDVGGLAGTNFGTAGSAGQPGEVTGVNVSGVDHVGGLVGYNAGPVVGDYSGAVVGSDYVGGDVGLNYASLDASAAGTVNGVEYVGGSVGWNDTGGTVTPLSVTSAVTATGNYAGGVIGVNKGTVSGIQAGELNVVDSVSGVAYVGGLVGLNQGSISYAGALVPVTGDLYVGGLVGWNDTGATISTSYATGSVSGTGGTTDAAGNDYVGGLVGVNFGSIANSYATGAVSGVQVVGGLVGTNMPGGASVSTSYATGSVTASAGAAGTTFGVQASEVTDVYGFPSLSGQPVESGYYNAGATGNGTDLTLQQEDGSSAYTGFDFTNTWQSNPSGPPTLQPQGAD